jgi:hypothetical protein
VKGQDEENISELAKKLNDIIFRASPEEKAMVAVNNPKARFLQDIEKAISKDSVFQKERPAGVAEIMDIVFKCKWTQESEIDRVFDRVKEILENKAYVEEMPLGFGWAYSLVQTIDALVHDRKAHTVKFYDDWAKELKNREIQWDMTSSNISPGNK